MNKDHSIKSTINDALRKLKPQRKNIDLFKTNLIELMEEANQEEHEEHLKTLISDFLKNTYYSKKYAINTKGRNDLVIHNGPSTKSSVAVIMEIKRQINAAEMMSLANLNTKAMQELVLYYLRERILENNFKLKHIIATNLDEWFVFDAQIFDRFFAQDKKLVKEFKAFESQTLTNKKTDFFYREIAAPHIEKVKDDLQFTHIKLKDFKAELNKPSTKETRKLIHLYRLFSPAHLMKLPFENDSNSLDKKFYTELLHIIGLTETKKGGKKVIDRASAGQRNSGSLLENAITQIDAMDKLSRLKNAHQYGDKAEQQLFGAGLELCITWVNRILFLKLLEAQLLSYHKRDKAYQFLNSDKIKNFDDLNKLFFQVLAKKHDERQPDVNQLFKHVPYLNSSLYEPSEIEHQTLFISNLADDIKLPIISTTVLKDTQGKKRTGELNAIEYLFEFLNAYDFSSEGSEEIQEDNKTLINAAVLGLIFEKINGYKDGSFFTPGFITMYMCKEVLRKAVVNKFNEVKGWQCEDFKDLHNEIEDYTEANQIINSLTVCDPAVGSGHFLVSSLNEILAIKSELKLLFDRQGRRLKNYDVKVVNDDLVVKDEENELFSYNPNSPESQRIQETLFHEKQTFIENCLFGVDINPNSVKICRLRLWIELLKNAYYKNETELETLPNIDINIKCGNSLISRFALDADLKKALKQSKYDITSYRVAVNTYRNATDKAQKRDMQELIDEIKGNFKSEIAKNDPKLVKLTKLQGQLVHLTQHDDVFGFSKKQQADFNKKAAKMTTQIKKLEAELEEIKNNAIYRNAFEWRFEFPEVLDDEGNYLGFDVVIGNPPYIKEYSNRVAFDGMHKHYCYQGKMDIWYLFGALALDLLKKGSMFSYIAPNNWITNSGASKFRNEIIKRGKINKYIDFHNYMIFDSAAIQTMIMNVEKNKLDDTYDLIYAKALDSASSDLEIQNYLEEKDCSNFKEINCQISRVKFKDSTISFIDNTVNSILDKVKSSDVYYLDKSEVAQGVVAPQDFLNKKSQNKLGGDHKIGDGVFVLSQKELDELNLTKNEIQLIKPYFTSNELGKYCIGNENKYWLIYTDSKFKKTGSMDKFPSLKKHLCNYSNIITSSNKPYGLHRARNEKFFQNDKIVSLRKCKEPTFTFSDDDCYVSQTFNIIQPESLNSKYLTGLFNSKLIKFWLKYKGKMQGSLFQIDKAPLLNIPIKVSNSTLITKIRKMVDLIIHKRKKQQDTTNLEAEIEQMVFQLYDITEDEINTIEQAIV